MTGRSANLVHTKTNSTANVTGRLDSLMKNKVGRQNTEDDHNLLTNVEEAVAAMMDLGASSLA